MLQFIEKIKFTEEGRTVNLQLEEARTVREFMKQELRKIRSCDKTNSDKTFDSITNNIKWQER